MQMEQKHMCWHTKNFNGIYTSSKLFQGDSNKSGCRHHRTCLHPQSTSISSSFSSKRITNPFGYVTQNPKLTMSCRKSKCWLLQKICKGSLNFEFGIDFPIEVGKTHLTESHPMDSSLVWHTRHQTVGYRAAPRWLGATDIYSRFKVLANLMLRFNVDASTCWLTWIEPFSME